MPLHKTNDDNSCLSQWPLVLFQILLFSSYLIGVLVHAKHHESTPRFLLPEQGQVAVKETVLKVVYEVLKELKLPEYDKKINPKRKDANNHWALAKDTDEWDLMWSWSYTHFTHLGQLDSHHRINHFPGGGVLTIKKNLFKTLTKLQHQYGPDYYRSIVPRHFILPDELPGFHRAVEEAPNSQWIRKNQHHRGVQFIHGDSQLLESRAAMHGNMIAELVDPFLIEGYKFDIGLYTAVTSLEPLRVFVHSYSKIRACKLPYPKDRILDDQQDPDSYRVAPGLAGHRVPWEVPGLDKLYQDKNGELLPSEKRQYINDMHALKVYMEDNDLDYNQLERALHHKIAVMVAGVRPQLIESAHALKIAAGSQNFFELFRFDFVVDKDMNPWLMEVNTSPNLVPLMDEHEYNHRRIVRDLLNIVIAPPKKRVKNPPNQQQQHELQVLKTAVGQYEAKMGYKMIVPDATGDGMDFGPFIGPLDQIQWDYFESQQSNLSRAMIPQRLQLIALFLGGIVVCSFWCRRRRLLKDRKAAQD